MVSVLTMRVCEGRDALASSILHRSGTAIDMWRIGECTWHTDPEAIALRSEYEHLVGDEVMIEW